MARVKQKAQIWVNRTLDVLDVSTEPVGLKTGWKFFENWVDILHPSNTVM